MGGNIPWHGKPHLVQEQIGRRHRDREVPRGKGGPPEASGYGSLETRGMPKFAEFPDEKLESIRHYLRARAAELRAGTMGGTDKSGRIGP